MFIFSIKGLVTTAIALSLIAGNQEQIIAFFDNVVLETQKITTAGDIRSICQMLDINFIRKGRYPSEEEFPQWVEQNFKENNIRDNVVDNFGFPFVYTTGPEKKSFKLVSIGPDGLIDTEDDFIISGP
jgi:general secretion pathway protein G